MNITKEYLKARVDNMNSAFGSAYSMYSWTPDNKIRYYALLDNDGNRVGQHGYTGQRMESLLDGVKDVLRTNYYNQNKPKGA